MLKSNQFFVQLLYFCVLKSIVLKVQLPTLSNSYFGKAIIPVLFAFNLLTRGYGIWFRRLAWDEEQFYQGGHSILLFLKGYFANGSTPFIGYDLVSIYGPAGKYIAAFALAVQQAYASVFGYHSAFDPVIFIRIFSSFIPSLISVWLLMKISRKLFPDPAYTILVLLLAALSFRWVESAHYATPDSLLIMAVLWAINECLILSDSFSNKAIWRLALAVSLSLACKINVALLLWATVNLYLIYINRQGGFRNLILRVLIFNGFMLLFSFILMWPYVVYLEEYLLVVKYHISEFPFVIAGDPLIYFIFKPAWGIGWGILSMAAFGLLWIIWRMKRVNPQWLLLLSWMIVMMSYLSVSRGAIPRWELPLIPVLLLLASVPLMWLKTTTFIKSTLAKSIAALILIVFIWAPVKNISGFCQGLISNRFVGLNAGQFVQMLGCEKVFRNYSFDYPSVSRFQQSDCKCALIDRNYWNDLETNDIPARFENQTNNASFIGLSSQAIRNDIRKTWIHAGTAQPMFHTDWTFNPALPPVIDVYIKPTNPETR